MANVTGEVDDGWKMIEELTSNAEHIQEEVLGQILKKNAGTEYLSRYLKGETDNKLFKKNVPIVTYEDIKPYIDRIANGETSNILVAEPVTEFYQSSGTSGGQPKFIPATAENTNLRRVYFSLLFSVMEKHFGSIVESGKILEFMFARQEIETPCGLKARSVSTSRYKDYVKQNILSKRYTSPAEAIFCLDSNQSMYCQLLTGLIHRDDVVMVSASFSATVLRAIKFLEYYWKELCSNIRTGRISDRITNPGCRNVASSIMKPDPQLADSMENICGCKSWEGIIKKLWPKAKFVSGITTGPMSQYVETLKFYGGDLPLVSAIYASSEAYCGINLELLSGPYNVSYTLLPNIGYFEFLPVNKDDLEVQFSDASRHESMEPVDLVDVKLDQYYELLITSYAGLYRYKVGDVFKVTGFHNSAPQFQFVERRDVILSIYADKTSEAELLMAVTEAKTLLEPFGFILRGYTSCTDTFSILGHYVLFWELEANEGNHSLELDPKIMEECGYRMEESLNYIYRSCRKLNAIGALEIRVVKQGSFDALMEYNVSRGASMAQYKTLVALSLNKP